MSPKVGNPHLSKVSIEDVVEEEKMQKKLEEKTD